MARNTTVNAIVQNDGTITADANAYATGRTYGIASQASAEAGAVGVRQLGSSEGSRSITSLTNSSTGSIVATANAVASGAPMSASAGKSATISARRRMPPAFIRSATYATEINGQDFGALAEITNNGTIKAISFAVADASSGGAAGAYAAAFGARQYAVAEEGDATVTTTNTASESIAAYANARATAIPMHRRSPRRRAIPSLPCPNTVTRLLRWTTPGPFSPPAWPWRSQQAHPTTQRRHLPTCRQGA